MIRVTLDKLLVMTTPMVYFLVHVTCPLPSGNEQDTFLTLGCQPPITEVECFPLEQNKLVRWQSFTINHLQLPITAHTSVGRS